MLRGLDLAKHGPDLLLVEDHMLGLTTHLYLRRQGLYKLVRRRVRNNWYIPRDRPFDSTSLYERLQLFRKVWLSPPFRRLRRRIKHGRPRTSRWRDAE